MALSSAARRLTRSACHCVRQHDRGDSLVEHLQFLHRWVIRVCEPEDPTSPPHRISPLPYVGAGVGYVRLEASPDPVRVRAAYVSDADITAMAAAVGYLPGGGL